MNVSDFKGVYTATWTPYDKNGNVDLDMQAKVIDFHYKNGIKGLYLCGSTGEGAMLTEEERVLLADNACKNFGDKLKTIVHIGHVDAEKAASLGQKAVESGADAVSSINPYYYRFSKESLYRYYKYLDENVDLPMIVYTNPSLSGEGLDENQVLRYFDLKNVVGAKYTGTDFFRMMNIASKIKKDHIILSGSDENMAAGLIMGTDGSIGTDQNHIPGAFVKLYEYFKAGEIAKVTELQMRINDLIALLISKADLSYFKAVMRYIGFDCGFGKRPFIQLSEAEYSAFAKELEQFDDLFALSVY